jgi:hypothetical protein
MLTRMLFWRLVGLLAGGAVVLQILWFLDGGARALLKAQEHSRGRSLAQSLPATVWGRLRAETVAVSKAVVPWLAPSGAALIGLVLAAVALRLITRHRRRYTRLHLHAYRADRATSQALVAMFEALHQRLLARWWRRLLWGQPSLALEAHVAGPTARAFGFDESQGPGGAWLAVTCPRGMESAVQAALQSAYANVRLSPAAGTLDRPAHLVRLKKRSSFIARIKVLEWLDQPPIDRLLTVMSAAGGDVIFQLALTPAPPLFERWAKRLYRRHELATSHVSEGPARRPGTRSQVDSAELLGGLSVQHHALFFADLRVVGPTRRACEQIASELGSLGAENRLVQRGATIRQRWLGMYDRRVARGEGNPLPSALRGVLASTELPTLWQLPSVDYMSVPFARSPLPLAPASPAILRPAHGGCLVDAMGPVSIHEPMRRQNTAVPGTVEQGKTSYLVATIAEDLARDRCAVIVLDPKGDAAEAAVSLVPQSRTCTLLDFAHPTCGFDPLAVQAPADVIADYVVAALRNLFSDADIRASSDRYLRNSIIAVLAADSRSNLWDAARLLSVGPEGYSYRQRVAARVRSMPEFKEISDFFTAELSAQLSDARSMTTSKLDAPVNKLARLLNSASIKRVLLNDSLRVNFDRIIAGGEVLVVRGALGEMGAGNTAVLMQLLLGALDAALARQQDRVPAHERVAVALKIDEAPLVVNRGFAETMALKRSAGLETVACWQTDAQWTEREVRDQLDALFAHRVYFATASVRDARDAASLMMAEFSDSVRTGDDALSALGRPDVRLRLPRHHAIASWTTPRGRQPPFVAQTLPLNVDGERLTWHAERQAERGGAFLADLRQPHWDGRTEGEAQESAAAPRRAAQVAPNIEPAALEPQEPTTPRTDEPRAPEPGETTAPEPHDPATPESGETAAPPVQPAGTVSAFGYRELVDVDHANRARWASAPATPPATDPAVDAMDLDILLLVARLGHVLSSQIHRRFGPARATTTTQRRLKRLADAGLIARLQFHRPDGGGVPMCCVITEAGLKLLGARERLPRIEDRAGELLVPAAGEGNAAARQARHDLHVAGWLLAAETALSDFAPVLRGCAEATLSPPSRSASGGSAGFGPRELQLPGGRVAHGFLRTGADGVRTETERFDTVRPDGAIELRVGPAGVRRMDLLVVRDDRAPAPGWAAKLERYDHLVAGWAAQAPRYRRLGTSPRVVFVCRDARRARECAHRADAQLTACRAYAGEYPAEWQYPGRDRIVFAAERDVHEGRLVCFGVPALPPEARIARAEGDASRCSGEPLERDLAAELEREAVDGRAGDEPVGDLAHERS